MNFVINDIESLALQANSSAFSRLRETSMLFISSHRANQLPFIYHQQNQVFFESTTVVNLLGEFEEFYKVNKTFLRDLSKAEMSSVYLAMLNKDTLITEHTLILKIAKVFNVNTMSVNQLLDSKFLDSSMKEIINTKIKLRI